MKTISSKCFVGLLSFGLAAMAIVLIAGCNTAQPSKTSVAAATVTEPPAGRGGPKLWTENCASCHNLRSASTYSNAEWDVAMHHMRLRANLTAEETRAIRQFLKAAN